MSIFINVVDQKMCAPSDIEGIVDGSQEFVRFKFNFSKEWDGLTIFAQFGQNGKFYNQYLDEDKSVYLPTEIKAGVCTLMLYGSREKVIATTNYLSLTINESILVSDVQSTEISLSLYNQLVSKFNVLDDKMTHLENSDVVASLIESAVAAEISEYLAAGKLANMTIEDNSVTLSKLGFEKVSCGGSDWETRANELATDGFYILTGAFNPKIIIVKNPTENYILQTRIDNDGVFSRYGNRVTGHWEAWSVQVPDGAITTEKIRNVSITTEKIANSAVFASKIANSAVTTAKINRGAVTTEKLEDGAVTIEKLRFESVFCGANWATKANELLTDGFYILEGAFVPMILIVKSPFESYILQTRIEEGGVFSRYYYKPRDEWGVWSGQVPDKSVTTEKIADGAVTTEKLADGAVTEQKLSQDIFEKYLYYPLDKTKTWHEPDLDTLTEPGMYYIDTLTGRHNVVCVLRSDNSNYTMQVKYQSGASSDGAISSNVLFRSCVDNNVWTPWLKLGNHADVSLNSRRRVYFKKACSNWSQPRMYLFNSNYARGVSIEAWSWDKSPYMEYAEYADMYFAELPSGFENCIFFCDNKAADGNNYKTTDLTVPPETFYKNLVYVQSTIGYDGIWADQNTESYRLLIQYCSGGDDVLPTVTCDGAPATVSLWGKRNQAAAPKPYAIAEIPTGTERILIDFGDGKASYFNTQNLCYNLPVVIYHAPTGSFSKHAPFDACKDEWLCNDLFVDRSNIKISKELWQYKESMDNAIRNDLASRNYVNSAIAEALTDVALADNAVTTSKIADDAVTAEKLSTDVVQGIYGKTSSQECPEEEINWNSFSEVGTYCVCKTRSDNWTLLEYLYILTVEKLPLGGGTPLGWVIQKRQKMLIDSDGKVCGVGETKTRATKDFTGVAVDTGWNEWTVPSNISTTDYVNSAIAEAITGALEGDY